MDEEEDNLFLLIVLLEENELVLDCNLEESNFLIQENGEFDVFDEFFDVDGDGEFYIEEVDDGEIGKIKDEKENLVIFFGDMEDFIDEEVFVLQLVEQRVFFVFVFS